MLAPLVFERQRPVTSIRADRAAPSTVFTMVSLPRRFWKEPVLRSQGRNGSRKERVSEKGGGEEREREMKVKACHGCRWLVSPLPPSSNPFSTHSFLTPLSYYQLGFILFLQRTHTSTHTLHSFPFLLTCTYTLLFWSFIQSINRKLHQNIHRQRSSLKFR